jgi:hypothetical protein
VIASYDEDFDELDPNSGKIVHHKKGEYKLNPDGQFYYETIGDRNVYDKELLHIWDTLTVDGSTWNKFDIFDSDGIEKSVAK